MKLHSLSTLGRPKVADLRRLARFLGLTVDGMSHRHVARYVSWKLRRLEGR